LADEAEKPILVEVRNIFQRILLSLAVPDDLEGSMPSASVPVP
jgi:hypothetical protein